MGKTSLFSPQSPSTYCNIYWWQWLHTQKFKMLQFQNFRTSRKMWKCENVKLTYCISWKKKQNKFDSIKKGLQYSKYVPTFNEFVIKNTPVKKIKPFFMEGLHLLHRQMTISPQVSHETYHPQKLLRWVKSRKKMVKVFWFRV